MDSHALYDVLLSFKDIHKVVLNLADSLTDEQLNWKPEGYSTSIGFHLWHLGRESDYLKAALLQHYPLIGSDFGDAKEIWAQEDLAKKWDFPAGTHETVGTGLSDEVAANLPIPKKDELLDYLRAPTLPSNNSLNYWIPATQTLRMWMKPCRSRSSASV